MDPADYVLRDVPAGQREDLRLQVEVAADAVESLVNQGLQATQNLFHQSP
jgi:PTH1 family peptidyl-tRNA hydrolase